MVSKQIAIYNAADRSGWLSGNWCTVFANSNKWLTILHPYIKITFIWVDSPHHIYSKWHNWVFLSPAVSCNVKVVVADVSNAKATDAAPCCQHLCCCSRSQYHWLLYTAVQGGNYTISGCTVVGSEMYESKSTMWRQHRWTTAKKIPRWVLGIVTQHVTD